MSRMVAVVVAVVMVAAGAGRAHAQSAVRDRTVARDRMVFVDRYQGRDRDQREQQTERTTRTLKLGANGEVYVANIAGNIAVVRGGGNEATLEIVKTSRGRTVEDAREMLELVHVDITERGSRAEIKTRYPQGEEWRRNNRRNINVSVAMTLTAPAGTRVQASSISGDISTKDIKGDVALESVSGSVRIANAGRIAAAKSISGSVEITDTEIEGQLEASSVSGTVLMRNVKARSLEAGAVSGNVVVQDVSCDRVEAQTVSGDVQFSGTLARGGRYELSSHSGTIRAAVGGDTGFEVEATSFSGDVRSDIPLKSEFNDGRRRNRTIRGVYGDGSAVLDLTTFSGSIVISRR
jgi:DUF4097 and DUF4098 domain-containing protein YvlB